MLALYQMWEDQWCKSGCNSAGDAEAKLQGLLEGKEWSSMEEGSMEEAKKIKFSLEMAFC